MAICFVSIAMALVLSSQVASASSPTPLVKDVCKGFDFKFCVESLSSEPRVVSATDLVGITIALIEAGSSKAEKTQSSYVQKQLRHPGLKPDFRYVLQQCDAAYNYYRGSFESALVETKDKEYLTANYDIQVSIADGIIGQCQGALGSKKIKDGVISKGNDLMILFGRVAAKVLARLLDNPDKRI